MILLICGDVMWCDVMALWCVQVSPGELDDEDPFRTVVGLVTLNDIFQHLLQLNKEDSLLGLSNNDPNNHRLLRGDLFVHTGGARLSQQEAAAVFLHLSQNVRPFQRGNRAISDAGLRKLIENSLVVEVCILITSSHIITLSFHTLCIIVPVCSVNRMYHVSLRYRWYIYICMYVCIGGEGHRGEWRSGRASRDDGWPHGVSTWLCFFHLCSHVEWPFGNQSRYIYIYIYIHNHLTSLSFTWWGLLGLLGLWAFSRARHSVVWLCSDKTIACFATTTA